MLTYYPTQRRVVKPRPVLMRLTALAWGCVATVCALLITCGVGLIYIAQIAQPIMFSPTVATSVSRQAVVPVATPASLPVQMISAEAKISESPVDSWVIDPTLDEESNTTASAISKPPQQLAEEIDTHIKQYYSLIKDMPLPLYLAQHNTLLPLFFVGKPLKQLQDDFAVRNQYTRYTSGNAVVKIDRLSPSGTVAIARIVQKSWATEVIDVQTGSLVSQNKSSGDVTLTARLQRGADNRWRIADILNSLAH